jgi:hypothetical protein
MIIEIAIFLRFRFLCSVRSSGVTAETEERVREVSITL